jgi:hypothetical protein
MEPAGSDQNLTKTVWAGRDRARPTHVGAAARGELPDEAILDLS